MRQANTTKCSCCKPLLKHAAATIAFWNEVATHPRLVEVERVLGDHSLAGRFADHLARRYGIRFEKPVHSVLKKNNFYMRKQRWLVERTLAWLSMNRRLSKEYDRLLTRANAWLTWATSRRIFTYC